MFVFVGVVFLVVFVVLVFFCVLVGGVVLVCVLGFVCGVVLFCCVVSWFVENNILVNMSRVVRCFVWIMIFVL